MPNQRHANAVSEFAVNEVVGKPFQICPTETRLDQEKSPGLRRCCGDDPAQLRLEVLAQPLRHRVVALQRLRHVPLDGGMILDSHRLRLASTRSQNSVSFNGCTCPLWISRSRRSASASSCASDHSSSTGGREPRIDSTSSTRCSMGSASTVFSISSRTDMRAAYSATTLLQGGASLVPSHAFSFASAVAPVSSCSNIAASGSPASATPLTAFKELHESGPDPIWRLGNGSPFCFRGLHPRF